MDESWQQTMNDEFREKLLEEALQECVEKGVSQDSLRTLMYETGARFWPDEKHVDARASSLGR